MAEDIYNLMFDAWMQLPDKALLQKISKRYAFHPLGLSFCKQVISLSEKSFSTDFLTWIPIGVSIRGSHYFKS